MKAFIRKNSFKQNLVAFVLATALQLFWPKSDYEKQLYSV